MSDLSLFSAYMNEKFELVNTLIDSGIDLETKNEEGYTLLMYICILITENAESKQYVENYDMDVINLLIDSGANVNVQDKSGRTPLILLSEFGVLPVMRRLIEADANVNMQDNDGFTALMMAVIYVETTSSISAIELLLNAGADVSIENKGGIKVIDFAKDIDTDEVRNEVLNLLTQNQQTSTEGPFYIDTSKTVEFNDPIMMTTENINIGDYIAEDPLNIVIMYDTNKYFFTNRATIEQQREDATVYPCKVPNTMRRENIMTNRPLYDLKKIGLIVPFCDMRIYNEDPNYPPHQLFALIKTTASYPSFVSDNVLYGENVSYVSRLHCQSGQESQITKIVFAEARVGGATNKKNKNKKQRYRHYKTFKLRSKRNTIHTKKQGQRQQNKDKHKDKHKDKKYLKKQKANNPTKKFKKQNRNKNKTFKK